MRVLAVAAALPLIAAQASLPIWPSQYAATGTITLPYANITQPFVTYFDGTNQRQFISYYSGMDTYVGNVCEAG